MKKRIIASLSSLALIAIVGVSSVSAALTVSETIPGNPKCAGTKIDPVNAGTYNLVGGGHIVITLTAGNTFTFDVQDSAEVSSIIVKGGPNYLLWTWSDPVGTWTGLHAPLNLNNGKWYGLSHLCIESEKKDSDHQK